MEVQVAATTISSTPRALRHRYMACPVLRWLCTKDVKTGTPVADTLGKDLVQVRASTTCDANR